MKQNKVSMWRMPALLLAFGGALIFGGCSNPSDSDDAETEALGPISGLIGTPGPNSGEVTLNWTEPEETDLVSIEISWTWTNGNDWFSVPKGKLTYTFVGLSNGTAYTFTLKAVGRAGNKSEGVSATVIPVAPEPVSALDLTNLVTRPEPGAWPVTTIDDTAQYTGAIAWKRGEADHSGVFAESTVYKAVVTLTAKTGYTFTGVDANSFLYTYTGTTVTNAMNEGIVTITFPATKQAGISIGENPSVKILRNGAPLVHNGTTSESSGSGIITVSIDPSYASVVWYLNGTKVTTANGNSLALPKRTAGIYQITVEAAALGGAQHSGAHTFVIQ